MENFEKCTVAMIGGPCSQHVTGNTSRLNQPQSAIRFDTAPLTRHGQNGHQHAIILVIAWQNGNQHAIMTVRGWLHRVKIGAECMKYVWLSNAKLSCAAQQVGIVHFYAVTEIKGLSCHLWWMREWRNLVTSTHVGYRVCHVGSCEWHVTKIWGPMCERDWFSRVNGTQDNGIRLFTFSKHKFNRCPLIWIFPTNRLKSVLIFIQMNT